MRGKFSYLKKFILIIVAAIIPLGTLLVVYCASIIHDASKDILSLDWPGQFPMKKNSNEETQPGLISFEKRVIEGDSIVFKEELKAYFLFSQMNGEFDEWIESLKGQGILEELRGKDKNSLLLAKEEIILPMLLKNNCKLFYCFQYNIPFEEIPPVFWKGLIGIEDYRFLDHQGVDYLSILRAAIVNLRSMETVQGGSTLTQQLVKNLFLTSERSYKRKFKEVIYSIYLETKLEKEEILTAYFNEVYWGGMQGMRIKGIYSASIFYFGKRPTDLRSYEVAILISLLKGPSYYGPLKNLEKLKERTDFVFKKLISLGLFPLVDLKSQWNFQNWSEWKKSLQKYEEKKLFRSLWNRPISQDQLIGPFNNFVLVSSVEDIKSRLQERNPNLDLAAKVIIGNPFCITEKCSKYYYYSKTERNLLLALKEEKHQIGSIIKPILYDIYGQLGMGLWNKVDAGPIQLNLKSGPWTPREPSKILEEEVILGEALRRSLNSPTVRVASLVGFQNVEKKLKVLLPELKTPLSEYPAQLLGALELDLDSIFNLYSEFIRNQCLRVRNNDETKAEEGRDESILSYLSFPELSTVRRSLGTAMKSMRFFGKTGTTNNGLNNWFVGFDGQELIIIWFGVEGHISGKNYHFSGSKTSFPIYQEFLTRRGKRLNELSCHHFSEK